MRNVPPTTANYAQRAGRVGRRAGKPGYAITFARLRPHDIAFFEDPAKIISGETRAPACYLDNGAIALRHVFAVAMSEFFRFSAERGRDYSHKYHAFMDLSEEKPLGLEELRRYLSERPVLLEKQLDDLVPKGLLVRDSLGIDSWSWVSRLAGSDFETSRLLRTHALKHSDYERVLDGVRANMNVDNYRASSLLRSQESLEKERTISVLAENGILPKYGFPTDLVELHLSQVGGPMGEGGLSLSRGMRQAIREYAPGSEVVAGKTLWKVTGLRKPRGRELEVRRYGKCPECGTFVWPIENYSSNDECPVCHLPLKLGKKMLIPAFGFTGVKSEKGIGLRRPRARGYANVYFSQHWPSETEKNEVGFLGGTVRARYAGNGQLCALNAPRAGFQVCDRCHGAAISGEDIRHAYWCGKYEAPYISNYSALGTSFVSDILELVFDIDPPLSVDPEPWESVMWALRIAGTNVLEVPGTELGGTIYKNAENSVCVMIYDDVPGGAGHTRQLSERVSELIEEAYRVVDGHCGCGDETCCYGCLASYQNQSKQAKLSRGAAKMILGSLLGKHPQVSSE